MFNNIDHIRSHKLVLSNFRITERTKNKFCDHKHIKLESNRSDVSRNGKVRTLKTSLLMKITRTLAPPKMSNQHFYKLGKLTKDLQKPRECLFKRSS